MYISTMSFDYAVPWHVSCLEWRMHKNYASATTIQCLSKLTQQKLVLRHTNFVSIVQSWAHASSVAIIWLSSKANNCRIKLGRANIFRILARQRSHSLYTMLLVAMLSKLSRDQLCKCYNVYINGKKCRGPFTVCQI